MRAGNIKGGVLKQYKYSYIANCGEEIKKGQDRNPAPFKIQYPMKNRYINALTLLKLYSDE